MDTRNSHNPPIPISELREEFLANKYLDEYHPPEPLLTIDSTHCSVKDNSSATRNLFILPWLLGIFLTLYWNIDEFMSGWKITESSHNEYIALRKKKYGDDYFKLVEDPVPKRKYRRINKENKMPLENYLSVRYEHSVGGQRTRHTDIALIIFYSLSIPGLSYMFIRARRRAPLYFNREKQIYYTWRKGKVWAQRYALFSVNQDIQRLMLWVRGESEKGELLWYPFVLQPSGNPFYNDQNSYNKILAFLVRFMEQGQEAAWPAGRWQTKHGGWYFFDDPKPDDFEQQLSALLTRIDNN